MNLYDDIFGVTFDDYTHLDTKDYTIRVLLDMTAKVIWYGSSGPYPSSQVLHPVEYILLATKFNSVHRHRMLRYRLITGRLPYMINDGYIRYIEDNLLIYDYEWGTKC